MPHIHTEPGQHDMTVGAYIIRRRDDGEWLCLVHMHRKIDMLMQVGGHIELDQTPWQAIAAELRDETGYDLDELTLLQWSPAPKISRAIVHPQPFIMNTHKAGEGHYHSDSCYAFVAKDEPARGSAEGESDDLRWLTLEELQTAAADGEALQDVLEIYTYLLNSRLNMLVVSTADFSLEKPTEGGVTYKR